MVYSPSCPTTSHSPECFHLFRSPLTNVKGSEGATCPQWPTQFSIHRSTLSQRNMRSLSRLNPAGGLFIFGRFGEPIQILDPLSLQILTFAAEDAQLETKRSAKGTRAGAPRAINSCPLLLIGFRRARQASVSVGVSVRFASGTGSQAEAHHETREATLTLRESRAQ
jgi:hypothetical protein